MNDEKMLFTEVYDKYYKQIFLYANYRCDYNEEANDITQNVFMTLWQEINKAGKLPAENMLAWLRKVANNRLSDYYKHRDVIRKRSVPLDEVIENTYSVVFDMEKEVIRNDIDNNMDKYIEDALRVLTSAEYELYKYYYIDGLNHEQIAKKLGISPSAERVRLFRIREKVKTEIKRIIDCCI